VRLAAPLSQAIATLSQLSLSTAAPTSSISSSFDAEPGHLSLPRSHDLAHGQSGRVFPRQANQLQRLLQQRADVSQILLKNGLELSARFFLHFEAYASITYTNFLNDAFIDNYLTPEVGLRFAGNPLVFAIAAFGDTANDYDSLGARATLAFNF
jgi:hypothetical protein